MGVLKGVFWQVQGNVLTSKLRPGAPADMDGTDALLGGGSTLGLRTALGIVQFGVGSNTRTGRTIGYFNFGFRL